MRALLGGGHALLGHEALGADAQDLTGADIAHILGADNVERAGQLAAHVVTAGVDGLAVHDGVGASKVDLFEDAVRALLGGGHALLGHEALGADAQDLTGADIAHILGADNVERAGLGGNVPAGGGGHDCVAHEILGGGGIAGHGGGSRGGIGGGHALVVGQTAEHERTERRADRGRRSAPPR